MTLDLDFYQTLIEEKAKKPRHFGTLADPDVVVRKKDILANDELELSLKLSPDGRRIVNAKWQGQGCAISKANMEQITETVLDLGELEKIKKLELVDVLKPLGLEKITPSRFKCVDLGWQVLQSALDKLPSGR